VPSSARPCLCLRASTEGEEKRKEKFREKGRLLSAQPTAPSHLLKRKNRPNGAPSARSRESKSGKKNGFDLGATLRSFMVLRKGGLASWGRGTCPKKVKRMGKKIGGRATWRVEWRGECSNIPFLKGSTGFLLSSPYPPTIPSETLLDPNTRKEGRETAREERVDTRYPGCAERATRSGNPELATEMGVLMHQNIFPVALGGGERIGERSKEKKKKQKG